MQKLQTTSGSAHVKVQDQKIGSGRYDEPLIEEEEKMDL